MNQSFLWNKPVTPAQPQTGTVGSQTGGIFGAFGGQPTTQPTSSGFATTTSSFGSSSAAPGTTPSFFGVGTSTPAAQQPQQGAFNVFGSGNQLQSGFGTNQVQTVQSNPPTTSVFGGNAAAQPTFAVPQATPQTTSGVALNQQPGITPWTAGLFHSIGQPPVPYQAAVHNSIFTCNKYGDERDLTLANLNFLQASYGAGKGFYDPNLPPVSYTAGNNSLYRFVGVTYSCLCPETNDGGQVILEIAKPLDTIREEEARLLSSLQSKFATPNIFFSVKGYNPKSDNVTEVILQADDRITLRRILATEMASTLMHPFVKPFMEELSIVNVKANIRPNKEQLEAYLNVPPPGVPLQVWRYFQEQNPDPEHLIPTVLLGAEGLKNHRLVQTHTLRMQKQMLRIIELDASNMYAHHCRYTEIFEDMRQRQKLLTRRILLASLKLFLYRKRGLPLEQLETEIINHLKKLKEEAFTKDKFKDRIHTLMVQSATRLQQTKSSAKDTRVLSLGKDLHERFGKILSAHQAAINQLVKTLKNDVAGTENLTESIQNITDANEEYRERFIVKNLNAS